MAEWEIALIFDRELGRLSPALYRDHVLMTVELDRYPR